MKKKIFTAIIAIAMVFTLAACGFSKNTTSKTEKSEAETVETKTTKSTKWSTLKGDDRKLTDELKSIFAEAVKDTDYAECEPKELDAKKTTDTTTNYRFICDDDVKVVVQVDGNKYIVLESQSTKIAKETESASEASTETNKDSNKNTTAPANSYTNNSASTDSSIYNNTPSPSPSVNNNYSKIDSSSNGTFGSNPNDSSTETENAQPVHEHTLTTVYIAHVITCDCGIEWNISNNMDAYDAHVYASEGEDFCSGFGTVREKRVTAQEPYYRIADNYCPGCGYYIVGFQTDSN